MCCERLKKELNNEGGGFFIFIWEDERLMRLEYYYYGKRISDCPFCHQPL
jgi:hypothetical protein